MGMRRVAMSLDMRLFGPAETAGSSAKHAIASVSRPGWNVHT